MKLQPKPSCTNGIQTGIDDVLVRGYGLAFHVTYRSRYYIGYQHGLSHVSSEILKSLLTHGRINEARRIGIDCNALFGQFGS